jgi:hypothetical protein
MLQETLVQDALTQEISFQPHSGPATANLPDCPNCGQPKPHHYCGHCGAEGVSHHELSLKHFLHHTLHEFTHVEDSKVLKTLKFLLFYPGKLTTEYFAGRKTRYLSPIRVFLIVFGLSIFVYSAFKTNVLYDVELIAKQDKTGAAERKLDKLVQNTNLPREEVIERINHKWQQNMSLAQLPYLLLFSFMLKILYRKRYLVEHIIFSCHFIAYSLSFAILTWPVHYYVGLDQNPSNFLMAGVTFLISGTYLSFALKRVYGQSWTKAIIKAVVIFGFYLFVVNGMVQLATLGLALKYF